MKTIKKSVLVLSITMLHFTVNAAIITVSNNPNIPGQYNSLQAAIDAAAPNDTLYIQGSTTSYGNVNLYKKLTLIGVGAMPNKSLSLRSQVGDINIKYSDDGTSNGSGSAVYGCKIYTVNLEVKRINNVYYAINNITLSRNHIIGIGSNAYAYGDSTFSGININNNYIGTIYLDRLGSGSVIKNNIIENGISSTGHINSGNWLVINNVINYRVSNCTNGIFINNIIYAYDALYCSSINYCDFTKNIFYTTGGNQFSPSFLSSSIQGNAYNTTSENIINQNPGFVYYDSNNGLFNYSVSYPVNAPFIDYHLSNSSPGKNYGTDGTDIGIYGGTTPFVEGATTDSRFRYFPMPAMPQMLDLTITNQSIPANSTLNVNFSAEKKN